MEHSFFLNNNFLTEHGLLIREIPGKREMWKVSHSNINYYVKIFSHTTLLRKLISVLKLSKPFKESGVFQILNDKDILIPELIEYGVHYGLFGFPLKEYIITKEVENSLRLKDFFFGKFQYLNRQAQKQLISEFAHYIKNLHDKGVMHLDPNLGNFLIKREAGSKSSFYILDLADVRIKSMLDFDKRHDNLAFINLNFFRTVPPSLRYYFFKNYVHAEHQNKTDILKSIKTIEDRTLQLANKTWAKRMKWCLGNNSFFSAFRDDSLKIHIKKEWLNNKQLIRIVSSPDAFLDNDRGIILKNGKTVKAAKIDTEDGKSIFLKRYNKKGFFHTFKNIFRHSRAEHVWKTSWGFELRRIPSPPVIAYIEERKYRVLKRSYIASEFIENAAALSTLFSQSQPILTPEEKLSVLNAVGKELRTMHALGCLHGDVKWSNILIKKTNTRYKCLFTDLDGSKIRKHLSNREIMRELSRFYLEMVKYSLCPEEKEAFLRSYYKHNHAKLSYTEFTGKVESVLEKN